MTAIFATCKKTASTECKNDKFLKYSIFSIQYSIDSILYLWLNIKYQAPTGAAGSLTHLKAYEVNHHRVLSKRKFSFQYPLGLGAYSHRIIQPVTRNPDDFIPAQHDRAFGPFDSGYFVINKKFF